MDEKMTLYDENLRLERIAVKMELTRDYVVDVLRHESYPQMMDRTLCLLLDIDYDEIKAEKEAKA